MTEILEEEDEDDDEAEPMGSADREYTLKQLQAIAASNQYGALDPLALETYLSVAVFEAAFGRSMSEFAKLPAWRKRIKSATYSESARATAAGRARARSRGERDARPALGETAPRRRGGARARVRRPGVAFEDHARAGRGPSGPDRQYGVTTR